MSDIPGPIELLDPAQVAFAVESPEFARYEMGQQLELDAIESAIDSDVADAAAAIDTSWDQEIDTLLTEAREEEALQDSSAIGDPLDDAYVAAAEVDQDIIDGVAELPGEAWQPVPVPIEAPPAEIGVPAPARPGGPGELVVERGAPRVPAPGGPPLPAGAIPEAPYLPYVPLPGLPPGGVPPWLVPVEPIASAPALPVPARRVAPPAPAPAPGGSTAAMPGPTTEPT